MLQFVHHSFFTGEDQIQCTRGLAMSESCRPGDMLTEKVVLYAPYQCVRMMTRRCVGKKNSLTSQFEEI